MSLVSQIERGLQSPSLFFRAGNRVFHKAKRKLNQSEGVVDIFSEDWDNMFLLDACRYDMFSEHHTLPGRLESRISSGSSTVEFLHNCFHERELLDTVYITANPQLYRNSDEISVNFHDEIHVWQEDGWDDVHKTVRPETVTEYAIRALEQYPKKRLLVHYIQPHYPFIGPTGRKHFDSDRLDFWQDVMTGEQKYETNLLWDAFTENLEVAMPAVKEAMMALGGKTIVTADHGQMVGERAWPFPIQEYGHPHGIYTEELVKVPWLVHQQGNRRETRTDQAKTSEEYIDEDVVNERLKNLGYT